MGTDGERLVIPYPVIVEGRYDRLRLLGVIDAQILTTDGFGVFRKEEKRQLLRTLAQKTPLIVLTDSDGAGKVIRSHLTSVLPAERLIQLYVPRIEGKEKRKEKPSAEGILGVEGMERDLLYRLFAPYAQKDTPFDRRKCGRQITKTDLYLDGLTGKEGSESRRDAFAGRIGLPPGMTPNAFLTALNLLCTYEEYRTLADRSASV